MFGLNKTIYTGIFVVAASASLLQMGLLGNGIVETVAVSPAVSATPVTKPTNLPTMSPVVEKGFKPEHIAIADVNIDLPVVSVLEENGGWTVTSEVANYAEDTSYINSTGGNVGIFAQDTLNGFARTKSLLTGSDIVLYNNDQKATYIVLSSSDVTTPDDKVFEQTKEPMLTLVTIGSTFSQQRHIVKAKLVKIEPLKEVQY